MLLKFSNAIIAVLLTLSFSVPAFAGPKNPPKLGTTAPKINKIVRIIEMSPIPNPSVDYVDQSSMDALGVKLKPGRVGQPAFNQQISGIFGYEIKEGAKFKHPLNFLSKLPDEHPSLFVENDIAGGAGRAGFLEVAPGVYVNKKGPGKTGVGRSAELRYYKPVPAPPLSMHVSNADGGMDLVDGIMEIIYGRSIESEMRSGGSRVTSMIRTGRFRVLEDGTKQELVTVDRTLIKRLPKNVANGLVNESMAEGNARRFLKGDFLNQDNMGVQGEWVDYGCTTHTCDYIPAASSEGQSMFHEGNLLEFPDTELYEQAFGKNLLNQMGIPEAHLQKILQDPALQNEMRSFGRAAIDLKDGGTGKTRKSLIQIKATADLAGKDLKADVDFNAFYRDAAGNYFDRGDLNADEILQKERVRLRALAKPGEDLQALDAYVQRLHKLFQKVESANAVQTIPDYGKKLRQIAHFKNRESEDLMRAKLYRDVNEFVKASGGSPSSESISHFIEEKVMDNRFTTAPVSDANFITRANSQSSEVFVRAFAESNGEKKLFQFPELPGAKPGEAYAFSVSTDGGKTVKQLHAEFVQSGVGDYFKVTIPHGSMPVTSARITLVPQIQDASGKAKWVKSGFELKGPTLLFNERLGLPADLTRRTGYVRNEMGQKTAVMGWDLPNAAGVTSEREPIMNLIRDLSTYSKGTTVEYELSARLKSKMAEAGKLYTGDTEFKNFVDQLLVDLKGKKLPLEAQLSKLVATHKGACGTQILSDLVPASN